MTCCWDFEEASGGTFWSNFRLPLFDSSTGTGLDVRLWCCPLPPEVEAFEICSDSLEVDCSSELDSGAGSSPSW